MQGRMCHYFATPQVTRFQYAIPGVDVLSTLTIAQGHIRTCRSFVPGTIDEEAGDHEQGQCHGSCPQTSPA